MISREYLVGLLALMFSVSMMFSADLPDGVKVGDKAPDFFLTNVDGQSVGLETFKSTKGVILVFTCNHCPYAIKYQDRIIALHEKYAAKGVPVLAINPNDPNVSPEDSYEKMKVRAEEKGFKFPYIFDETQKTALSYGARRTPHVFLLKKAKTGFTVEYIGAIDDNANDAAGGEETFLSNAVDKMLEGQPIAVTTTKAIGCSIKWKKD